MVSENQEIKSTEEQFEVSRRSELYDQFNITAVEEKFIRYLSLVLEWIVQMNFKFDVQYDTDPRSQILAEIAVTRAYIREPKFKLFTTSTMLIALYDLLHPLPPSIYPIFLIGLATLNGFLSSVRSPTMLAAEIKNTTDEDGMPVEYRHRAVAAANTTVTIVLFAVAIVVQVLVTTSVIQGEILTQNIADGFIHPSVSALMLLVGWYFFERVQE